MTVNHTVPQEDHFDQQPGGHLYPSAPPLEHSFNPSGNDPSCSFYAATLQPACNPEYTPVGQPIFHSVPQFMPHQIPQPVHMPGNQQPISSTLPARDTTPVYVIQPVSNQEINQMDEISLKDDRVGSDDSRYAASPRIARLEPVAFKQGHGLSKQQQRRAALIESAKRRRAFIQKHKRCWYSFFAIVLLLMVLAVVAAVLLFLYSQRSL
uniref:Uncharacterized protein n=1 Tax=Steinernema glaseri TaxID=37863 RepID=A0A1I8A8G0_9BILA